jgi:hypothetical protein
MNEFIGLLPLIVIVILATAGCIYSFSLNLHLRRELKARKVDEQQRNAIYRQELRNLAEQLVASRRMCDALSSPDAPARKQPGAFTKDTDDMQKAFEGILPRQAVRPVRKNDDSTEARRRFRDLRSSPESNWPSPDAASLSASSDSCSSNASGGSSSSDSGSCGSD